VARASRLLEDAQVVAYPTETVYGLGVDAARPAALDRLFALKGRPRERGLSVLICDAAALEARVPDLPEAALRLARSFWPGPLTLVVPVRDGELAAVATELGVGFRCSPHATASALARRVGRPLVATSCNRSGGTPCVSADEVEAAFGPDLPIAGGESAGGLQPSTVVAVDRDGTLSILRQGSLAERELRHCLEDVA
jgi:L-threonylcarbamoyladenylate synthase